MVIILDEPVASNTSLWTTIIAPDFAWSDLMTVPWEPMTEPTAAKGTHNSTTASCGWALSPYARTSATDAWPPWLTAPPPLGSPAAVSGTPATPLGIPASIERRPPSLPRSLASTGCVLPAAGVAAEPVHSADVTMPADLAAAVALAAGAAPAAAIPAAAAVPEAAAMDAAATAGDTAVIPTSAGSPPLDAAKVPDDGCGRDEAAGCGDGCGWAGATAPSMLKEPKSFARSLTLVSRPSSRCLADGTGTMAAAPVPGAASTASMPSRTGGVASPDAGASGPMLAADPRGGGSADTPDAMAGWGAAVGVPPAGIPIGGTGLATAASINGCAPGASGEEDAIGTCPWTQTPGVC